MGRGVLQLVEPVAAAAHGILFVLIALTVSVLGAALGLF